MQEDVQKLLKSGPVALFGTGASARAAARLLDKIGTQYIYYSENANSGAEEFNQDAAKKHSFVVYSPAFRPDHKWLNLARENGAITLCEPDFASLFWNGKIVSISGTNGKTTLTSFLAKAFSESGFFSFAAGNIGTPLSDFCADFYGCDNSEKIAVCEISSFQSAALSKMRSDAFIWTNFAPDHLDWHTSLDEYFNAKLNIVKLLKSPIFIASKSVFDYATMRGIELPEFAQCAESMSPNECPPPFDSPVQAQNYSLACALWKAMLMDESSLRKAAEGFELAKYRFHKGEVIDDVEFINDSKATNVHAAEAAIEALSGRTLIWIGGGKNKNCDLSGFADLLCSRAKKIFLIGQTAEILKGLLKDREYLEAHVCNSLQDAVKEAYIEAKKLEVNGGENPVVLFSPAFSSFGMFSGYSERGKVFQNAVFDLKNFKNYQL